MTAHDTFARELTKARERTLRLVDFDDAELWRQYDPLMSPLVWDLAHIGQQEELWLLRGGDPGRPSMLAPEVERLYDAFVHSRASRVDLPLLPPTDARTFCSTVRGKALDSLDALPDDRDVRAEAEFRFGLVISHENQHDETMLQGLNLRSGPPLLNTGSWLPPGRSGAPAPPCSCPPGNSYSASTRSASRSRSTTNGRRTRSMCRPSASAACP